MGGGMSSERDLESVVTCAMLVGQAMSQSLDPRYIRFPDMYRIYDFHVGENKHKIFSLEKHEVKVQSNVLVFTNGKLVLQSPQLLLTNGENFENSNVKIQPVSPKKNVEKDDILVVPCGEDKVKLKRSNINQPNNDGWTPLHACCHTKNTIEAGCMIADEMFKLNQDFDLKTTRGPGSFSWGWTPLHIASAYGLEKLVAKLIECDASVNVKNSVEWTPLHDASHRGHSMICRYLVQAGACLDIIAPPFVLCPFPGQFPLAEACRQGHIETVKTLLNLNADKDATNEIGWTPLHEAAYCCHLEIVQILIVHGADVLIKSKKGYLASRVTVSSEIRKFIEDAGGLPTNHKVPSPKKVEIEHWKAKDESNDIIEDNRIKKNLKGKPPMEALSRKEQFELLGDLPSFTSHKDKVSAYSGIKSNEEIEKSTLESPKKENPKSKIEEKSPKKNKSIHKDGISIPKEFLCEITHQIMSDPVRTPLNNVFEKTAIEAWITNFGHRCPISGEPLGINQLNSDIKLKEKIDEWHSNQSTLLKKINKEGGQTSNIEIKILPPEKDTSINNINIMNENDIYDF